MTSDLRFTMRRILAVAVVLLLAGVGLAVDSASAAEQCKENVCATTSVARTASSWKVHFTIRMRKDEGSEFFLFRLLGHGQMKIDGPGNHVELDLEVPAGWDGTYAVETCRTITGNTTSCLNHPWATFQAELPVAADDQNFCIGYAGHATSAGTAAQQQNCGFDTPPGRWSTDNSAHLNWCLNQIRGAGFDARKLVAARNLANSEEAARTGGLEVCQSNAAAAQKAYAAQRAYEIQVTGKNAAECQASNFACEARIRVNFGDLPAMGMIPTECAPYLPVCLANAAAAIAAGQAGATPAPGQVEQPPAPVGGGAQTASTCGLPGGTATVVIADPTITELNVRDKPKGDILSRIPEGTQVTVVGGCGVQLAAGIVAQQGGGQPPVPGWCAITSPKIGCVSEQFLVAGIPAGEQVDLPPAAGIVATQPQTAPQPPPPVAAVPPPAAAGGLVARLKQGANIRNGSNSKKTKVLGSLEAGSIVTVVECTSHWCRLALPTYPVAWVSKDFLEFGDFGGVAAPPASLSVTIQIGDGQQGGGGAPPPAQAGEAPVPAGGQQTASTCGLAGGTATVVIADPKVTTLNVRDKPSGNILTKIPEGTQVTVVGGCGVQLAAGIVAKAPGTGGGQPPVPGWCAITSPKIGCVSEQFLVAGIPAGEQVDLPPAAGIVATQPQAATTPTFAGTWNAEAQGSGYTFTLNQDGNNVAGDYTAGDGSSGQINGSVSGNVLRFTWSQPDGLRGAGRFALSADGGSFTGSYTLGNDPDVAEGSWNGARQ